jgi:hypothetical protein
MEIPKRQAERWSPIYLPHASYYILHPHHMFCLSVTRNHFHWSYGLVMGWSQGGRAYAALSLITFPFASNLPLRSFFIAFYIVGCIRKQVVQRTVGVCGFCIDRSEWGIDVSFPPSIIKAFSRSFVAYHSYIGAMLWNLSCRPPHPCLHVW